MRRMQRTTNPRRVILAALAMFAAPVILISEGLPFLDPAAAGGDETIWFHGVSIGLLTVWSPLVIFVASPYLLSASAAWAVAHSKRRTSPLLAASVGALEGAACALWGPHLMDGASDQVMVLVYGVFLTAGIVTGLAVWRIAYRPERLVS